MLQAAAAESQAVRPLALVVRPTSKKGYASISIRSADTCRQQQSGRPTWQVLPLVLNRVLSPHPSTSHWLPATAVLGVPQISGVILLES